MAKLKEDFTKLIKSRETAELGQKIEEESTDTEEQVVTEQTTPTFKLFLTMDQSNLVFNPHINEFLQLMSEIGLRFKDCAIAMPRLVNDALFLPYISPIINGFQESKCTDPPSLEMIFNDDDRFEDLLEVQYIPEFIQDFNEITIFSDHILC